MFKPYFIHANKIVWSKNPPERGEKRAYEVIPTLINLHRVTQVEPKDGYVTVYFNGAYCEDIDITLQALTTFMASVGVVFAMRATNGFTGRHG